MRVAIVHYWFLVSGGGERVVETLADMFPDADFFVLFADKSAIPDKIRSHLLTTSFLDRLPLARKMSRAMFPLYPTAIESFDMRKYDLVITSDSPPVKGLILNQSAVQICYCHTPGRYLWDLYAEFRSELPRAVRPLYTLAAQYVRGWDFAAAQRVDHFVANSNYVAQRIWKYYRRQSSVIYPPIETGRGYLSDKQEDYYLSVGRLVHNKRLDLVIQACNRLGRKLLIAGAGRSEKQLKALAGPTVEFLGRLPDREIDRLYAKCKAFLFAADEDFGIAPVEAQSFGRPVICLGRGGSRETVLEVGAHSSPTGVLFAEQTVESVIGAILRFEAIEHIFEPRRIQAHSRQFDKSRFEKCFKDLVRHEVPLFTEEAPVQGVLAANAVNG